MKEKILPSESTVSNVNNKKKVITNPEPTNREVDERSKSERELPRPKLCLAELENPDREAEPVVFNHQS
jgi:hypothetical protein